VTPDVRIKVLGFALILGLAVIAGLAFWLATARV
jgi:hypothetical protein